MNISPLAKPHTLKSKGLIKTSDPWLGHKQKEQSIQQYKGKRTCMDISKQTCKIYVSRGTQEQMFIKKVTQITLPLARRYRRRITRSEECRGETNKND